MTEPRRRAEILATIYELRQFIDNSPNQMRYYREIPRSEENIAQAHKELSKMEERLKEPQNAKVN